MKFRAKLTISFLVVSLFTVFLISFLLNRSAINMQMEELRSKLMTIASLAAMQIDTDQISQIKKAKDSDIQQLCADLRAQLSKINQTNKDIQDIYIMVRSDKQGIWKFLANSDPKQVINCGEEYDVTRFPEMMGAFEGPRADKRLQSDKWGTWLSGYAPIKDKQGVSVAIAGVDVSAKTVITLLNEIRTKTAAVFLVGILIAIISGSILSNQISKPIAALATNMNEVKKGNLDCWITINTHDEIQLLGDTFNKMLIDLKKYIDELQVMTAEKERIKKELDIAAQLQKSILPTMPPEVKDLDIAGFCIPAREVGGDWFDYIELDKHHAGFVIADASGKGLPGALLMTNSRSVFKAYATESMDTGKVLELSNKLISKDVSLSGRFITFFYALFDPQDHKLTYSNAGHNPPILIKGSDSKVIMLDPVAMPLGVVEDQKIQERHMILDKGDIVLFYTDGVTEAKNDKEEMFGEEKLIDLIIKNKEKSAKEIISNIKNNIWSFAKNSPQYDDFTLLLIKVKDGKKG